MLRRLDRGYTNFFEGRAKRPPQFKGWRKYRSMTFNGNQVKIEVLEKSDGCPVAKIRINGRWYRFWYSREIRGNIKRVTLKRDPLGDWYLTILTDDEGLEPALKTGRTAGFDFGLKTFLTCSDSTKYNSPLFYKHSAKKVKQANRALSKKNVAATIANGRGNTMRGNIARLLINAPIIIGNSPLNLSESLMSAFLKTSTCKA